jgi:hypothetical protein
LGRRGEGEGIFLPSPLGGEGVRGAAAASGLLLADDDGWSLKHIFKNANSRTRVVQVCIGIMCLALFILIKK